MGLFSRKAPAPEAAAPALAGQPYSGGKKPIFREGFFYLCDTDADGRELGPDLANPLVYDADQACFVYAHAKDINHFHRYGHNAVELNVGGED